MTDPIFWWPSLEAFDDLTVTETEDGFTLEAPDNSECGEWIAFFNQDDRHRELLNTTLTETLLSYLEKINGKTQAVPNEQGSDRVQT